MTKKKKKVDKAEKERKESVGSNTGYMIDGKRNINLLRSYL